MNHRGLQRALFRMQLDPAFAARLRARDAAAEASTRLGAPELALLRAADPLAISADRDGRRRAQLLSNVASEFGLSCAAAPEADWLDAFPASPQFHAAIAHDTSLPLAFAAYAAERAARAATRLASLVALERALAHARRGLRVAVALAPGRIALAPSAWLVELEDGTFAWASALRRALDAGAALPRAPAPTRAREALLVTSSPGSSGARLRDARAERLEPLVATLLRECETGVDESALPAFATRHDVDSADLESVVKEFLAEGALVRVSKTADGVRADR